MLICFCTVWIVSLINLLCTWSLTFQYIILIWSWQLSFIIINSNSLTSWFRIIRPGYWTLSLLLCYTELVSFPCSSNSYQPLLKCFHILVHTCNYPSVIYQLCSLWTVQIIDVNLVSVNCYLPWFDTNLYFWFDFI